MSVETAAKLLGVPSVTLRRALERSAKVRSDGSIVAVVDGVHARKLGRRWRVALDSLWLKPLEGGGGTG